MTKHWFTLLIVLWLAVGAHADNMNALSHGYRFDFGSEAQGSLGSLVVTPETLYSTDLGYGWDFGTGIAAAYSGEGTMACAPLLFSVSLPEGSYAVTVRLGGAAVDTTTTVKAESRRLMLEEIRVPARELSTRTFLVHVRTPAIVSGGQVRLKEREKPYLQWDEKLTLEFNGQRPCVSSVEICSVPAGTPTVYIAGDSTVCDQPDPPYNSWGQMLTRFFKPDVVIANYAMSGETIRGSLGARRFDKIFSSMQAGDTLMLQFGHNDMKDKSPNARETYRKDLEGLVDKTRMLGATPVLITSMERKKGVTAPTLRGYPQIVREVAEEKDVTLIDLNAMSKILYAALGEDLGKAFADGSHHSNYGSYQLAKCIVSEIQQTELKLAASVLKEFPHFDPSAPDAISTFSIPVSLQIIDNKKPEGN